MGFYIISLRHTNKKDSYMTLWRPEDKGYCYAKEHAGIYDVPKKGYHDNEDNMPISIDCDLFMTVFDVMDNGKAVRRIPNCKAVWDQIGVKLTKNGLIRTT